MASWYKVTLPSEECGTSGKAQGLQQAFGAIFLGSHAPQDAALFTNHDENFEEYFFYYFYFSPGAAKMRNL
jgi:hypothetical protein